MDDLTTKRDSFYFEARRICDERGLPVERLPAVESSLRYTAFQRAIQPYIQAQICVMALAMPKWMNRDGRFEMVDDGITEDMHKALAVYDDLIDQMARAHGIEPRTPESSPVDSTDEAKVK